MSSRNIWWVLKAAIYPLPVVVAFNDCVASIACIDGNSMRPTLNPDTATSRDR